MSERQALINVEYYRLRGLWLPGKRCVVFPEMDVPLFVHHTRGRAGPLLLDVRFWKPTSLPGHRWIEDHKDEARKRGWLCEIGLWNMPPKDAETLRLRLLLIELTAPTRRIRK